MTNQASRLSAPLRQASRGASHGPAATPLTRRIVAAGALSILFSLAADVILVAFGRAVFTVPKGFDEFSFAIYGPLTVIGVIGATPAWGMVVHRSRRPVWLFSRLAVIVSAVLLIPDFLLLGKPGYPTGPVIILMAMHVAIGITTYGLLTRVAAMRHPTASITPDKSM